MIYPQTIVYIHDNTGVRTVRCVHVEKKNYSSFATIRNVCIGVVCSVKKTSGKIIYKKGDLVRFIVTSSKKEKQVNTNSCIFYKTCKHNYGLLLQPVKKKQNLFLPIGSRFDGFFPNCFKNTNNTSLTTLTSTFI